MVVGEGAAARSRTCARLMRARGVEVAGQAGIHGDVPRLVGAVRADVAVVHLPLRTRGAVAARALVGGPCLAARRSVVVASRHDAHGLVAALWAGACGFVYADADSDELAAVVRAAATGKQLPNAAGLADLIATFPPGAPRLPKVRWSAVERRMVGLLAAGATNSEMASTLGFHPATTFAHVNHLMYRVRASCLMQLVLHAYDHGVIDAPAASLVAA